MSLTGIKRKLILLGLYIKGNGMSRAPYIKKHKLFYGIGEGCYFHPYKIPHEGYLLNIHDNVYVAANVTFITHDVMDGLFNHISEKSGGAIQAIHW